MDTLTTALLIPELPRLHGYARFLAAPWSDIFCPAEVRSLAYLAIVRAWVRFDPGRGCSFHTFARHHVRGELRSAVRRRLRARAAPLVGIASRLGFVQAPDPETVALAHEVAAALAPEELELATRFGGGESLAEIARDLGRHPSWASRKLAGLRARFAEPASGRVRPGLSRRARAERSAKRVALAESEPDAEP